MIDSNLVFQNGIIVTQGARKVTVNNTQSSAVTGNGVNAYVNGRLNRKVTTGTSYDFPVGGSPVGATVYPYELMNITFASLTGMSNLTVSFENPSSNAINNIANSILSPSLPLVDIVEGSYSPLINCGGTNTGVGIANYGGVWTALPDAGTATYNMILYGRNYDNASSGSAWSILKRSTPSICSTSPNWTLDGTYNSYSNSGTVVMGSRTGMSGFSQFALASTTTPLPVELLAFDVNCTKNSAKVSWITASETNNNYFTLERSCDNTNTFIPIATIQGAGNSSAIKQYSYIDNDFAGNICYYRLSQTDFNGTTKVFNTIAANCGLNTGFNLVSLLPNPADNELNIVFSDDKNESVTLNITDVLGQQFFNKKIVSETGLNKITLDLSSYSSGVYFVQLYNDNKSFIKRVLKNK